jgi:quercetin dioxygenase-like cupin family protein
MRLTYHCALLLSTVLASHAMAQEGIKRTPISTIELPNGYIVVTGYADIAKGVCGGRHTHPGFETTRVLEGELTFKIDGQPPKAYKAGDNFGLNEAGIVHDGCASPNTDVKLFTVHIVEKGKPLGTPVNDGTAEGAKAMLAKVTAALKGDKEVAMAQMLKGEGGFREGDLYPFCNRISDAKSIVTPRYVPAGTDIRTLKDIDGKEYGKELYSAATKPDGELTEVHYKAPKFGTLSPLYAKTSFVTKAGDMICGVGFYSALAN